MFEVPHSVAGVNLAGRIRHKDVDGLAQQLGPGIAEQRLRLRIDQYDAAAHINADEGIGRCLEQAPIAVPATQQPGQPV
jgi:hypothetical protein